MPHKRVAHARQLDLAPASVIATYCTARRRHVALQQMEAALVALTLEAMGNLTRATHAAFDVGAS